MRTSTLSALSAAVLGAAALLFSALSIPSALEPASLPSPTPPAAMELSLIITTLGPVGGRATHHFYDPQLIVARRGDTVRLRVMNLSFFTHAIAIDGYGVRTGLLSGGPRGTETISFVADKGGVFPYRCYIPYDPVAASCSPDHDTMIGYLVVLDQPR